MDTIWLIGIDDTDIPHTRGTGRLARMLAEELLESGMRCVGVTRHQLLVHPDVPYTSHNSSACIGVENGPGDLKDIFSSICDYVARNSPEGSDPGVCAVRADAVGACAREFGRRAQVEVVRLAEAESIGSGDGCLHAGLGGTRDGMIGSLAAVGLRSSGDDGRFIELGRIREIAGKAQVKELLAAGVNTVEDIDAEQVEPEEWVETLDWVRPRLKGGRAALMVKRSTDDGADWVVADRSKTGKPRS